MFNGILRFFGHIFGFGARNGVLIIPPAAAAGAAIVRHRGRQGWNWFADHAMGVVASFFTAAAFTVVVFALGMTLAIQFPEYARVFLVATSMVVLPSIAVVFFIGYILPAIGVLVWDIVAQGNRSAALLQSLKGSATAAVGWSAIWFMAVVMTDMARYPILVWLMLLLPLALICLRVSWGLNTPRAVQWLVSVSLVLAMIVTVLVAAGLLIAKNVEAAKLSGTWPITGIPSGPLGPGSPSPARVISPVAIFTIENVTHCDVEFDVVYRWRDPITRGEETLTQHEIVAGCGGAIVLKDIVGNNVTIQYARALGRCGDGWNSISINRMARTFTLDGKTDEIAGETTGPDGAVIEQRYQIVPHGTPCRKSSSPKPGSYTRPRHP